MGNEESKVQHTKRAFLVASGWLAEPSGLIRQLQGVCPTQKRLYHTSQCKFWNSMG